jgi:hypothetical protein
VPHCQQGGNSIKGQCGKMARYEYGPLAIWQLLMGANRSITIIAGKKAMRIVANTALLAIWQINKELYVYRRNT